MRVLLLILYIMCSPIAAMASSDITFPMGEAVDSIDHVVQSAPAESAFTATNANSLSTAKPHHWGFSVDINPAMVLALDTYQRLWQKKKGVLAFVAKVNYHTSPADNDAFAADYGYPTFSFGVRYAFTNATMHRDLDPAWGQLVPVDYDSRLGNLAALFGEFNRPYWRKGRWEAEYSLGAGLGLAEKKYNITNNIDDELIGSHCLIYFSAGTHLTYRFADHWALRMGIDFFHHSNGALARPNKGSNIAGPSIGVQYFPEKYCAEQQKIIREPFNHHWFLDFSAGIGGKTLLEDWLKTQFGTSPDSADYRTDKFKFFMTYSAQASIMYRYARRWATGIGADLFYGTYAEHIEAMDHASGIDNKLSRWSVGLALKHNAYYHNLSLRMAIGTYLYRHMGDNAKYNESAIYERIGVFYSFPSIGNLAVGLSVKAHITKADFTEFVLSYPITLKKRK